MNSNNYFEAALSDQNPYSNILQGTMWVFNALPLQGLTVNKHAAFVFILPLACRHFFQVLFKYIMDLDCILPIFPKKLTKKMFLNAHKVVNHFQSLRGKD